MTSGRCGLSCQHKRIALLSPMSEALSFLLLHNTTLVYRTTVGSSAWQVALPGCPVSCTRFTCVRKVRFRPLLTSSPRAISAQLHMSIC